MFLDDIAARLVAQNVGVLGTNIFIGSGAVLPAGAGPYLTLNETGGMAPTRVQNKQGANTKRPTAQIFVRASGSALNYVAARTMIAAAYVALDGISNLAINGTYYLKIGARQEPTDMGLTDKGIQYVFNIEGELAA